MRDGIWMWCFHFCLSFDPFIRSGMFSGSFGGGPWESGEGGGEDGWKE